ncbi:MAG: ATP-binding protein [Bryobacteraceae bacterium]
MAFQKAVKRDAKGRVALVGPAGSGKSYTMLTLARALAGTEGKIAAIDTEHGSLSKYADLFDFDVAELASFTHDNFLKALEEAARAGYAVFCCDSISHFWMGKDGALEFVDTRSKRNNGDSFAGWKDFRPHERAMIDAIIASPLHVIVTMRTKNEYVTEKNDKGKTVRRKIGLAPVQREGIEYEFDLVGTLDDDNTLLVDKTRCSDYSGKALAKPAAKDFQPFIEWLKGVASEPDGQKGGAKDQARDQGGGQTSRETAAPATAVLAPRATQHAGVPVPLRAIFERLQKGGYGNEALRLVRTWMVEAMPTAGEGEAARLIRKHNLAGKTGRLEDVKACLLEMYSVVEFAREQKAKAEGGYQATDEDVPKFDPVPQPQTLYPMEEEPGYAD